jgi:hypothetical protein
VGQSCNRNSLARGKLKEKLPLTIFIIKRSVTGFSMSEYPFDGRRDIVGHEIGMDSFQEISGGRVPARAKPTDFERHMAYPLLKSCFGEGLFATRAHKWLPLLLVPRLRFIGANFKCEISLSYSPSPFPLP